MRNIIISLISASLLTGCSIINRHLGLPDDNFAEEMLEFRIKAETGFDVDLTPASQE
jgi:hypothetical protein